MTAILTDRPTGLELHVARAARERYGLERTLFSFHGTMVFTDLAAVRRAAQRINEVRDARRFPELAVRAGELYALGLLHELLHLLIAAYRERLAPTVTADALAHLERRLGEGGLERTLWAFSERFPPTPVYLGEMSLKAYYAGETDGRPNREVVLEELLLLHLANENPALGRFRELFDDRDLRQKTRYPELLSALREHLEAAPPFEGQTLYQALRAPAISSPTSLEGQLEYLRERWQPVLGARFGQLFRRLLQSLDVLAEERKGAPWTGPGPAQVITFDEGASPAPGAPGRSRRQPPAYERFSPDSSWMPRVVMLAKSTYVWLAQLSQRYGYLVERLDQIPDEELDELARRGFTALWLIGLWERSEASRRIKHLRGNPEAVASAYALYDYVIAHDLGGEAAYENLRERAHRRGIRLASDMVPNHVGIDGKWVIEKPDYFLQLSEPPFPGYTFGGPDLSSDERVGIFLEDHYWDSSDAAVVFKRLDRYTGEARYLYHGNDGTTFPWNDTAQLDYLNPETREAVIQTILHVARKFPVIRFDAAMTLAKQHIQRLWFPEPGTGGAIPSRAEYGSMDHDAFERRMPHEFWREVVDRVAAEVPDTLLLAEAFWMMEPYFVRTLGMHRVYNSAFMHMFKNEENAEYRQSIKNTLAFDPEILKRFVNFMNNPDEETAVNQFGKDDKYFGVCVVMSTLPGLPMFGHGQVEGFAEKYGMEYRRAKHQEVPDAQLVARHAREVFPLLHRRAEFAEVENFALFDVVGANGEVNENVFAYANRLGDRASLVLYNNAYAGASGWIKISAPYHDKARGQRRRELSEVLGLGAEGFALMREHVSGLEYLKPLRELAERGLYCELRGYQYQVFLDIRAVRDEDGRYAELARSLGGRGVGNVAEALADLRYQPLYGALLELLAGAAVPEAALDAFLAAAQAWGVRLAPEERAGLLARFEDARAAFAALDAAEEDEEDKEREATPYRALALEQQPLLLAALLLRALPEGAAERLRLEPFWQRTFGPQRGALLRLLAEMGAEAGLGAEAEPAPDEDGARALLASHLAREAVRNFLRVNRYEGVAWFDQGSYRELASALALDAWLAAPAALRRAGALKADLAALEALERESGYRFGALLGETPAITRDGADGTSAGEVLEEAGEEAEAPDAQRKEDADATGETEDAEGEPAEERD